MKKGIFAMFILVASMAMVACTNANATNEGAVGENDAFKVLEKRREYYKEQDKERAETQGYFNRWYYNASVCRLWRRAQECYAGACRCGNYQT